MLILKPTLALIDGSLRGSYKPLAMQPCVSPLITSLPTPGRRLTSLPKGFFATGTASLHLLKQASQ